MFDHNESFIVLGEKVENLCERLESLEHILIHGNGEKPLITRLPAIETHLANMAKTLTKIEIEVCQVPTLVDKVANLESWQDTSTTNHLGTLWQIIIALCSLGLGAILTKFFG